MLVEFCQFFSLQGLLYQGRVFDSRDELVVRRAAPNVEHTDGNSLSPLVSQFPGGNSVCGIVAGVDLVDSFSVPLMCV